MYLFHLKRSSQQNRRLLLFISLVACSLSIWGQAVYFSTKTGQLSGAPQPDDQWQVVASGHWQVDPYNPDVVINRNQEGSYSISVDAGVSFNPIASPFNAAVEFHFDAAGLNRLYAVSSSAVSVSTDQGQSWTAVALPSGLAGPKTGRLLFAERNDGQVHLLVASGTQLWEGAYDASNALAWNLTLNADATITALAVNDEQLMVMAGTKRGLIHTGVGSGEWTSTTLRSGAVSAIAFDPWNDQRVAVGFADAPSAYISYNAGLTFTPIAGTLIGPVRQLLFAADSRNGNHLYALASAVFVTTDFSTWNPEAGLAAQTVSRLHNSRIAGTPGLAAESADRIYSADFAGGCSSSVSPRNADVAASGGLLTLHVNSAASDCIWPLESFSNYPLQLTSDGASSGEGDVTLLIEANSSAADRYLYANVAHQKVVIHQSGAETDNGRPRSTVAVSTPTVAPCDVVSVVPSNVGKDGGSVVITIRKTSACGPITPSTSEASWISLAGSPAITQNNTVKLNIKVSSNPGAARSGSVDFNTPTGRVEGAPVQITQDAAACNGATATIGQKDFDYTGGTTTLTLIPSGFCRGLTAKSDVAWVTLKSTGTNQFSVQVLGNPSNFERAATITVYDSTNANLYPIIVGENGIPYVTTPVVCKGIAASLSPSSLPSSGGTATMTITPSGSCTTNYSVVPNGAWMTAHQTATNQYLVSVAANTGTASRHGTIQVTVGQATTQAGLDQAGATNNCTGIAAAISQSSFPYGGGAATLNVTPAGACTPTVSSNASWIALKQTSTNQYSVTVAADSGSARQGTILVAAAGTSYSTQVGVNQASPQSSCPGVVALLSPTSFTSNGGPATLTIDPVGTCGPATVTSNASWVTVKSSTTNQVPVQVASNTTSQARTATLTVTFAAIPGVSTTVTVTQPGICVYTISPISMTFHPSGGVQNVNVTTSNSACSWTTGAVLTNFSGPAFVHLNRTQGTGSGAIQVSVDSDYSGLIITNVQGRSSTFTVAGVQVTVNQLPPPPFQGCSNTFQMGVNQNAFGPSGGQATITVLTQNSCVWTLNSDASFIQFPNGSGGTGNGTVLVNILPNPGIETRIANITPPPSTPDFFGNTAKVTITQQGIQ